MQEAFVIQVIIRGSSINSLQNGIILLIFKIWKIQDIRFRSQAIVFLTLSSLPTVNTIHSCIDSNRFLVHTVVKAPKFTPVIPILKSLHWMKINKCIECKILSLSLTYKVFNTTQPFRPFYLYDLISLQPPRCNRSSLVALARPPTRPTLKINYKLLILVCNTSSIESTHISSPHPHCFHHPSHLHSFIHGSKHSFFQKSICP